jgi:hypothetical protein
MLARKNLAFYYHGGWHSLAIARNLFKELKLAIGQENN